MAGKSSSRRIEIYPRSDWRRTGAGATEGHLEDHHYPVQLYCTAQGELKHAGVEEAD